MAPPFKRAGTRLRNLSVHAVAFVDEGANLSRFAEIRKSKGLPMADENGAAAGGTLPAAAQKVMIEGLSRAAEQIVAVLDFLKAAPVSEDPAAVVPAEVTEQVEQIGMQVAALGDQFAPPEAVAPGPSGVEMTVAPAPVVMSVEEAATVKGIGRRVALGIFKAVRKRMASPAVAKAAVKLTFGQHAKVQSRALDGLMSILMEIAPLLSGMDDADVVAALAPPAKEAGPPVEDAAAAKALADAAAKKAADEEAAKTASVAKSKALDAELADLRTKLEKLSKARGPSNAASLEAGPPPAPDAEQPQLIGRNFSEEFAAKQRLLKAGAKPNAGAAQ